MKPLHVLLAFAILVASGCGKSETPAPAPLPDQGPSPILEADTSTPPQPPPKTFEKKVVLKVQATTWREGETPFDIQSAFTEKLEAVGIQAVPETAPAKDAIVLLDYKETKGRGYSTFGMGEPNDYGTDIELNITVLSAGTAEVLLKLPISTSPPSYIDDGMNVYGASVKAFREDDLSKAAGSFVGAALGMKSAMSGVIACAVWLESRDTALALLKTTGYEPSDAREKAMLAIAREDYDACVALGKPAVVPLLQFLNRYYYPQYVAKVAWALGEIGDPQARTGLTERLTYLKNGDFSDELDVQAGIAVINALAKVGDMFALSDLDEVAKSDKPDVAAAATRAAKMIRTRATAK